MEGVPTNLDLNLLKKDFLALSGIKPTADIHVWSTGSKEIILTAHIIVKIGSDINYVDKLKSIQKKLICTNYSITHFTAQLVPVGAENELEDICQDCDDT